MGGVEGHGRRVGVFGGTFDPPHVGHLILAVDLRHALDLDRVLFVPAGHPPHKPEPISDDADRLAMVRLAIAGEHAFEISTVDVDRGGPSYSADLLAILTETLPDTELVFLMGEDSLRDFPSWHRPGKIATLAKLGVATRPGVRVDLKAVERAVPEVAGRVVLVPTPSIGVSSRHLRRRVEAGAPIAYQVPPAVERYIRERRLYLPDPEAGARSG